MASDDRQPQRTAELHSQQDMQGHENAPKQDQQVTSGEIAAQEAWVQQEDNQTRAQPADQDPTLEETNAADCTQAAPSLERNGKISGENENHLQDHDDATTQKAGVETQAPEEVGERKQQECPDAVHTLPQEQVDQGEIPAESEALAPAERAEQSQDLGEEKQADANQALAREALAQGPPQVEQTPAPEVGGGEWTDQSQTVRVEEWAEQPLTDGAAQNQSPAQAQEKRVDEQADQGQALQKEQADQGAGESAKDETLDKDQHVQPGEWKDRSPMPAAEAWGESKQPPAQQLPAEELLTNEWNAPAQEGWMERGATTRKEDWAPSAQTPASDGWASQTKVPAQDGWSTEWKSAEKEEGGHARAAAGHDEWADHAEAPTKQGWANAGQAREEWAGSGASAAQEEGWKDAWQPPSRENWAHQGKHQAKGEWVRPEQAPARAQWSDQEKPTQEEWRQQGHWQSQEEWPTRGQKRKSSWDTAWDSWKEQKTAWSWNGNQKRWHGDSWGSGHQVQDTWWSSDAGQERNTEWTSTKQDAGSAAPVIAGSTASQLGGSMGPTATAPPPQVEVKPAVLGPASTPGEALLRCLPLGVQRRVADEACEATAASDSQDEVFAKVIRRCFATRIAQTLQGGARWPDFYEPGGGAVGNPKSKDLHLLSGGLLRRIQRRRDEPRDLSQADLLTSFALENGLGEECEAALHALPDSESLRVIGVGPLTGHNLPGVLYGRICQVQKSQSSEHLLASKEGHLDISAFLKRSWVTPAAERRLRKARLDVQRRVVQDGNLLGQDPSKELLQRVAFAEEAMGVEPEATVAAGPA